MLNPPYGEKEAPYSNTPHFQEIIQNYYPNTLPPDLKRPLEILTSIENSKFSLLQELQPLTPLEEERLKEKLNRNQLPIVEIAPNQPLEFPNESSSYTLKSTRFSRGSGGVLSYVYFIGPSINEESKRPIATEKTDSLTALRYLLNEIHFVVKISKDTQLSAQTEAFITLTLFQATEAILGLQHGVLIHPRLVLTNRDIDFTGLSSQLKIYPFPPKPPKASPIPLGKAATITRFLGIEWGNSHIIGLVNNLWNTKDPINRKLAQKVFFSHVLTLLWGSYIAQRTGLHQLDLTKHHMPVLIKDPHTNRTRFTFILFDFNARNDETPPQIRAGESTVFYTIQSYLEEYDESFQDDFKQAINLRELLEWIQTFDPSNYDSSKQKEKARANVKKIALGELSFKDLVQQALQIMTPETAKVITKTPPAESTSHTEHISDEDILRNLLQSIKQQMMASLSQSLEQAHKEDKSQRLKEICIEMIQNKASEITPHTSTLNTILKELRFLIDIADAPNIREAVLEFLQIKK